MRKSAKFNSTDIGNNIYLNSTSGHEEGWTRLSLCTLGTSKLLLELFRRNADTPLTICILFYNTVPLELQLYYPHPPPPHCLCLKNKPIPRILEAFLVTQYIKSSFLYKGHYSTHRSREKTKNLAGVLNV
jgi:hypothetical protein